MNIKVDNEWDWKMRLWSHAAVIVVIAFLGALSLDGPRFLMVTLPLGALVLAFDLRRLQRDKRDLGLGNTTGIAGKRRRRAITLAGFVGLFGVGLLVGALPSQEFHDRYWFLLVTPVMIGFIGGVIALLMLGWAYLPRQEDDAKVMS